MDVTITVDNSESIIAGVNYQQMQELRRLLSYDTAPEGNSYAKYFFNTRKYLIDKRGVFPSGLLYLVESYLKSQSVKYNKINKCAPPKMGLNAPGLKLSLPMGVTPYPYQKDVSEGIIARYSRGTISAATGSGKSLLIALVIAKKGLKTLVVTPNVELKRQLMELFESVFESTESIVVENIQSPRLKKLTDFDVLIVDEAHHSAAKTYRDLNKKAWRGIYYRYFFTATPFRSKDEEQLLFMSLAGQVIYELDYKQALKNNIVVPIEACYLTVPQQKIDSNKWAEVYSKLVVNNDLRNQLILQLIKNLKENNAPFLVLVKEIKHGELLSVSSGIHFAHGQNEDTELLIKAFNSGKIKGLIGTVGVIGEGIDVKPTEFVIIAGLGKSKSALMQNIGRVVRKSPGKTVGKVVIFKDKSHKWTVAHFKAQYSLLIDVYGVEPFEVEL